MDKIIEKINKLSLPAVILVASIILGGFYYASETNKQKSIERQQQVKIEQEKQDQSTQELQEQEAKEQAKRTLNFCIIDAEDSYSNQWYRECKGQGKLTNRCISLNEMTLDEYKKQNNITDDNFFAGVVEFEKEKSECSCRLPLDNADRINKSLQNNKDECFRKYPQN